MNVESFMRKNPPMVNIGDSFKKVVDILMENKINSVIVVDEKDNIVGIISHSHAFKVLGNGIPQSTLVEDVMEKDIITITPDFNIDKLIDWNVSSLPVVENKKVKGIVTLSDTINAYNTSMIELQQELYSVINSAYNGIVSVDRENNIRIVNKAAAKYFDLEGEAGHAINIVEAMGDNLISKVVQTGEPIANKRFVYQNRTYIGNCTCIKDKNGNIDGAVGVFQDFTELEVLYKELFQTKKLTDELNAIFEASHDGILVIDKNGSIVKYNTAFEKLVGEKNGWLIDKSIDSLEDIFGKDFFCELMKTSDAVSKSHTTDIGRDLIISANVIIGEDGKLDGAVANVCDISTLKTLENKVAILNELYQRQVEKENVYKKYVFESAMSKSMIEKVLRVSKVDSTVLITGESGVGKEIVANILHANSSRKEKPLVKINCAAIPESLLESELFGYEEGAFTGAQKGGKIGFFEMATDGILLLDEIGDVQLHLQVKLLRAIQEKEIIPVGGSSPRNINVRIIAATNKNLKKLTEEGKFREDLYYRLNVVPIHVPPLRERKEDLKGLITHYLLIFNEKYGLNKIIGQPAMEQLYSYDWPGNVRELENIIERIVVTTKEDVINNIFIENDNQDEILFGLKEATLKGLTYKEMVEAFECTVLKEALKRYKTTRGAGKKLGIDQSTIVKKVAKFGIDYK